MYHAIFPHQTYFTLNPLSYKTKQNFKLSSIGPIQVSLTDYNTENPLFNICCTLVFGGRLPAPYIRRAWQAEHPAVHRKRSSRQVPRPTKIQILADQHDLPVSLCYFPLRISHFQERAFFISRSRPRHCPGPDPRPWGLRAGS